MLSKLRNDEQGFTLVELLVVILIIGILAAIALPVFLGQQKKGQDAEAKSNARNMVSHVESCFADTQDYTQCTAPTNTGLTVGTADGQVSIAASASNVFTITGYSKSGNDFVVTKASDGTIARSCTTAGDGGCKTGGTW